MRVYILHFSESGPLTRAFDWVLEAPDVGSCMIEADRGRIRFLAPPGVADGLVERIYQDGGLVFCSRHDLLDGPAATIG